MYADIAFTLGTYLQRRYQSVENRKVVTICDMVLERALVAQATSPQLLRTTVEVDWSKETAICSFLSVDVSNSQSAVVSNMQTTCFISQKSLTRNRFKEQRFSSTPTVP